MRTEVVKYRSVGDCDLDAHVYFPKTDRPAPAVVLFHGGNFTGGAPQDFRFHCEHLASRGMVAISAAYRLFAAPLRRSPVLERQITSRHAARTKDDCVDDAAAAIAWARRRRDVDPTRVAAGGFSAGGFLAACAAVTDRVRAESRPDALVLQSVAPVLTGAKGTSGTSDPGLPPTLVLIGSRDPFAPQARRLTQAMISSGRECQLAEYDGAHTVFAAQQGNKAFADSLARIDKFFVGLDYLPPTSDVAARIKRLPLPAKPKPRIRQRT